MNCVYCFESGIKDNLTLTKENLHNMLSIIKNNIEEIRKYEENCDIRIELYY